MIAFSDRASFSIRPFHAAHPQPDISRTRHIINAQPLVPPIGNLNRFTNFKRLAIPESLLGRDFPKLFPKLLEEMQLELPIETIVLPNGPGAEQLRTARLLSLADGKEEFLPLLKLVICWYQRYASSWKASLKDTEVYDTDQS